VPVTLAPALSSASLAWRSLDSLGMDSRKRALESAAGFSLLEMLVAVTLAAVVGGVAAPQFVGLVRQYRLTGAANQVAFEIDRARMQAIGQNSFVRIRFLNSTQYVRETSPDGVNYTAVGGTVTLPAGIYAVSDGILTTAFNKSGMALMVTTIVLGGGSGQKTVSTNSLGRVTVS